MSDEVLLGHIQEESNLLLCDGIEGSRKDRERAYKIHTTEPIPIEHVLHSPSSRETRDIHLTYQGIY
jgi:hypothetical protein